MAYSYFWSRIEVRILNFLRWLFRPTIRYSNITIFILSLVLAYFFLTSELLKQAISEIGNFGYVGAFVAGVFYTTSFTIAPSISLIYLMGKKLNPLLIALVGGIGALFADFLIFHFVKRSVEGINLFSWLRLKIFLLSIKSGTLKRIRKSKFAPYLIPAIAGLIIASPLPDEWGIALLGVARYETKRFIALSFSLNVLGILIVATLGKVI